MKRTPLTRKAPLVAGTLRGLTNADLPAGYKRMKRSPMKPSTTAIKRTTALPKAKAMPVRRSKPKSAATRLYMGRVAAIGCIACLIDGNPGTPAELHHPRTNAGAGQRAPDTDVVPLCAAHHRGTMHPKVPSIHLDRLRFIGLYGDEASLLERVKRTIEA